MFNSTVLEVAIGLVFCYASVALITSSIYEAISSWLDLRSKTLLEGIKNLLNEHDPNNQALLLGIYNHALASPLANGNAEKVDDLKHKPSYIDSKNFALALTETLQTIPGDFASLANNINSIQNPQIRQLLQGMYERSAGSIENLHQDIASWFDSGMDRVSGSYKRQSQLWCFVIALLIAIVFNIDSFYLFKTLWQHPGLVAQISSFDTPSTATQLSTALNALPIGWHLDSGQSLFDKTPIDITAAFIGWLNTASAFLFGGPFWFDLLKTLINLRGTGNKPKTP